MHTALQLARTIVQVSIFGGNQHRVANIFGSKKTENVARLSVINARLTPINAR